MKVNFNVPILTLAGQQAQEVAYRPLAANEEQVEGKIYKPGPDGTMSEEIIVPLFARSFVVHALSQDYPDERGAVDDKEKYARYKLLQRIENSKDSIGDAQIVSVSSEEIQTIRKLIAKLFSPVVVGQIIDIIEGE